MATTQPDIELQLIGLVKQGDPAALRTVYSTYIRYLTAVCSRYVPNNEDVKDVLHDSFIKIFDAIGSFEYRGKGSLKGWLTRITVNQALRFLHDNSRMEFVEISDREQDISDEEPCADSIPPSVIYNLIREMPDGYRTIFNLYVIEGKSHKEISVLLNIKESTSASQLHRAKSMLAAKIRQYQTLTPIPT